MGQEFFVHEFISKGYLGAGFPGCNWPHLEYPFDMSLHCLKGRGAQLKSSKYDSNPVAGTADVVEVGLEDVEEDVEEEVEEEVEEDVGVIIASPRRR